MQFMIRIVHSCINPSRIVGIYEAGGMHCIDIHTASRKTNKNWTQICERATPSIHSDGIFLCDIIITVFMAGKYAIINFRNKYKMKRQRVPRVRSCCSA